MVHLLKTGAITLTFICGLLPRDEYVSVNRMIIDEIKDLLSFKYSVNNFHFIDQSKGWTLDNGTLDFSLFYSDGLHLLKTGTITLTFICGLLPRDEYVSVNRMIIDEIKDLLSFKYSVNNFHFIDQSKGWTLDNGTLDFSLFYSDGLHLIEKGNLKLGKSILKAIDSAIPGSRTPSCNKNIVCSTDFHLNLEDLPTLPRIVPVRNLVSFNKSMFKVVSTSSVRPSKSICDSNVPPSKPVSASSFRASKPISNRNVRPSKNVSASSVSPGKPICSSNVSLSEHVSTIIFHPSKPIIGSNVR